MFSFIKIKEQKTSNNCLNEKVFKFVFNNSKIKKRPRDLYSEKASVMTGRALWVLLISRQNRNRHIYMPSDCDSCRPFLNSWPTAQLLAQLAKVF